MAELPRRAWVMELKIGADTPEEIERALEQIATAFAMGGLRSGFCSGGCASGWSGHTSHDPEMTHERYFEDIAAMRAKEKRP